ncbi:ASCH domain-containing protein [Candidatus Gracilibacteria bacterium]|nr:ASCH domain-containing protein [Candidatus Gracilibacteria bacterium]
MSKVQNILEINVQEPYLSFIRDGVKTVEGRLNKGKFKEIQVGDVLIIGSIEKKYKVVGKNIYNTIFRMVIEEGFEKVIPDKQNPTEAAQVYYKFFTKQQEEEFGVVAILITEV